jgi:ParB-like chromosome segregation protein Spo0J
MNIEVINISDLKFDNENARKHSKKNLEAISKSLKLFGQRKPIVVHQGIVIAGNGTLESAKMLGWTQIEIVRTPDEWDADKAKAFALADNRSAELAEWDDERLLEQLLELAEAGYTLEDIGFTTPKQDEDVIDADEVRLDEKYEVVIECVDEFMQQELLLRLSEEGLKVRALVL